MTSTLPKCSRISVSKKVSGAFVSTLSLAKLTRLVELGLMETIKLVNFIRSERRQGKCSLDISTKSAFQDDHYLQPVIEDDPLLYSLEDIITEQAFYSGDLVEGHTSFAMSGGDALKPEEIAAKFREHEHQLATTKEALQASAKQLELTERALQQVNARADLMMQQLDSSSEIVSTRQPDKSLKYDEHDDCYAGICRECILPFVLCALANGSSHPSPDA